MIEPDPKVLAQFAVDFPLYAKHVLRIIDKDGVNVPFILNKGQRIAHQIIEKQQKEHGYVRALAIKARQVGISTYTAGRGYWRATSVHNMNTFVLSHLSESTANLFAMVKNFHDHAPHPVFAPALKTSTTTSLEFKTVGSRYRVGTARSGQVGRSQTNRFVHGSEVAFYPAEDSIIAGLLQTVPSGRGEVLLESTANGVGGWFYDKTMKAIRGEGEWVVVFIPWFWMDEYRANPGRYFERTKEEWTLATEHNLDDEQLEWRRRKIAELDEDLFKQEYPSNPLEAFLFSGRGFLSEPQLRSLDAECWTAPVRGDIDRNGIISEHKKGAYQEWVKPRRGHNYVIGVDVAEGLIHGDYTVAEVLDQKGNQVACWRGHVDPYDFARILIALGRRFSNAFIIIERNNHGLTLVRKVDDLGYKNLYIEQTVDRAYADRDQKKLGFLTTSKSKPLLLDNLKSLAKQGEAGIADKELVSELRTYAIDERGICNAQPGCFDDRIMAHALALWGLLTLPSQRGEKRGTAGSSATATSSSVPAEAGY